MRRERGSGQSGIEVSFTPKQQKIIEYYENHRSNMILIARRIVGDQGLAEDIVQDVELNMLLKSDQFDDSISVKPWVNTAIRNSAIDSIRRKKARAQETVFDTNKFEKRFSVEDPSPTTVIQKELRSQIDAILEELPSDSREVITKHYLEEKGSREIAEEIGKPVGTVKTTILRAKKQLRQHPKMKELLIK